MDAKDTIQNLHFGVLNLDGVLLRYQYAAYLLQFFETSQICHLKIDDILRQSGTLRGVADIGTGALQAQGAGIQWGCKVVYRTVQTVFLKLQ